MIQELWLGEYFPANETIVNTILEMPVCDDGRSDFTWLRLQNGDLILGVFPTGEGYFEVELDVEADYTNAEVADEVASIKGDSMDIFEPEDIIECAKSLTSEHGENPEYDRALVEMTMRLFGMSGDRTGIEALIGVKS